MAGSITESFRLFVLQWKYWLSTIIPGNDVGNLFNGILQYQCYDDAYNDDNEMMVVVVIIKKKNKINKIKQSGTTLWTKCDVFWFWLIKIIRKNWWR